MAKTVVIVGTLDTKGEEIKLIKEQVERRGLSTIVIDAGILGKAHFAPDITRDQVAAAAGANLKEIIALGEEERAVAVMSQGLSKWTQQLYLEGRLHGIIAVGGSMGTSLGLAAMKPLPLGVPKLVVSTMALTPMINPEKASLDQIMMASWADMWGLNRWTKRTLESAAAAIAAMSEVYEREELSERPAVAITTMGGSWCKWVWHAKPLLEQRGYEVIVFHTQGVGGRTYEQVVEQGLIGGALDLSLHEVASRLCGAHCDAGADRLEAAGRRGIPQVVAPGMVSSMGWYYVPESLPPRLRDHPVHMHTPKGAAQMRMSEEEMAAVGQLVAEKLNKATGATVVLIPTRGFSEFDRPGDSFYVPEGRRAFAEALKAHIEPKVRVIELDVHINDPEFAEQAVALLDEMMKRRS